MSFHLLPDIFDFFFQTQPWYAIVQGLQSEIVAVKQHYKKQKKEFSEEKVKGRLQSP
jgi:hypothetical protein